MDIFVYSCRYDELPVLPSLREKYGVTIDYTKELLTPDTVELARGYTCISMTASQVNADLLQKMYDMGVRFISTRSIGFDHIDIESAKKIGMVVGHTVYSPAAIADFATLLILMAVRKVTTILKNYEQNDFRLSEVQGREIHNLTIGVIGTGRIGKTVIKNLSGFGCKLLAYDSYPDEKLKQYVEYHDRAYLYAHCDVLTFHAPATPETFHLLSCADLPGLKKGMIIVNTARGTLVETKALLQGLADGTIGFAALDVVEQEPSYRNRIVQPDIYKAPEILSLENHPQVMLTPHIAFHTDQAAYDMISNSMQSCCCFIKGEEIPWKIC